jgi:prepilin-type processing-associated H-X9-DG protein
MTSDLPSERRRTTGFSLWELLCVVFIVSLMFAVLIPSFQQVRDEAWKVCCLNNLREMVFAAHQYAYQNGERLPPAYVRDYTAKTTVTWESFLWGTNFQERVQQCPVFKGSAMWKGDIFTGYNYNSSYLGGTTLIRKGFRLPNSTESAKLFDIKNPAECAVFGDGEYESGANKFMRSPFAGDLDADASLALGGTQGFRHRGCTNVGFADGHCESLKKRYTTTEAYGTPAKGCGFLSEDNRLYDLE